MRLPLFALPDLCLRCWLSGLLVIWAALLFGGFVFARTRASRSHRMPLWTRLGSSLVLVLAAWIWCIAGWAAPGSVLRTWVAAGMTLGCVGDLLMAPTASGRRSVTGGMGAFGLGHAAYIAGTLLYAGQAELAQPVYAIRALLFWWAIGLAGWFWAVGRGPVRTPLHWLALPYALLLATTTGITAGLALQLPRFWPMAAGAALFLISDLILARGLFAGQRFRLIDDLIWLTYGPGQMLIVYTAGNASRILGA